MVEEVDAYLAALEEPKRGTLEALRRTILEIVPDAEQVISYRVPAFKVGGKTVAGFAAFKNHLSYLPFSGSVLPKLASIRQKEYLKFLGEPIPRGLTFEEAEQRLDALVADNPAKKPC